MTAPAPAPHWFQFAMWQAEYFWPSPAAFQRGKSRHRPETLGAFAIPATTIYAGDPR